MLDIKFIRQNPDIVKKAAKDKNVTVDVDKLLALDERKRHLQGELDQANSFRNAIAQASEGNKPAPDQIAEGKKYKEQASELEKEVFIVEQELKELLYAVPNIPTEDTPVGPDETHNKIIKEWGEKQEFSFKPKPHWELGESLDILDNKRAVKVSGARFSYFKREAAILEYAMIQFALSVTIKKGFVPIIPPIFIKPDVYRKMARLEPKEERYHISSDDLYLIGSAEHTLGPMHMDEVIPENKLPIRYVGFSPALRREAGAAGKDTRGILRLHEFHKVEMEVFSTPADGMREHLNLIAIEEEILQALGLPYQVILKCTADIGDPNARGVDINTWMPGQSVYKETHTADYMADYQAHRLNTRVRYGESSGRGSAFIVKYDFVHMNDATALAIGRTLAAILENYQTKEGTVVIPEALHPYTFGIKEIKR